MSRSDPISRQPLHPNLQYDSPQGTWASTYCTSRWHVAMISTASLTGSALEQTQATREGARTMADEPLRLLEASRCPAPTFSNPQRCGTQHRLPGSRISLSVHLEKGSGVPTVNHLLLAVRKVWQRSYGLQRIRVSHIEGVVGAQHDPLHSDSLHQIVQRRG